MTQNRIPPSILRNEVLREPQFAAPRLLTSIEEGLERAAGVLVNPSAGQLAQCQSDLETVAGSLNELCSVVAQQRPEECSEIRKRLSAAQKRARVVQALVRQGARFYRAAGQTETGDVLGYTPCGLEHART